ncbi:GPO family capsid scaffolding protein [Salmonella enterica]|nr:GPO family capsid scaffolding protein [Salmonella enterica]EJA7137082.1 GPO family capsid scaffolding protein [Salmonella enterica]EJK2398404.1 GPO family capsid scaffolding protein [Salmonella enterica]ELH6536556.1 GPO family capsid scaffolding protein [Salmonella enterica]ELR2468796.1 GPO family capsid scaffolding protein [Salmonella enterica]
MTDEKESEQPKVTGWVTICRSGRSLDGRNISARMLHDAADVYKPEEFTAMMWPFHVSSPLCRWNSTNFGKVLALKAEDRQDATYLLARLQPNKFALAANRDRQKIFTSAEFEKNYMGTGKSYLNGLALTDVPASPWTTELMFSQQAHDSIYGQPEVFSLGAEDNTEETHMNQQQYDTLLNAIHNKGVQINAVEARLNQFSQMLNQAGTQPQQPVTQPAPAQQFTAQPQPAVAQPQYYSMIPVQNQLQPFVMQPPQPQPAYAQPQQFSAQPVPAGYPPLTQSLHFMAAPPQVAQQFITSPPVQQPVVAQPQQYSAQPQATDALNNAQFQYLLTAISGINSGVAGMEQKFAQLMQDTTQTPSQNPAGGNQITLV